MTKISERDLRLDEDGFLPPDTPFSTALAIVKELRDSGRLPSPEEVLAALEEEIERLKKPGEKL